MSERGYVATWPAATLAGGGVCTRGGGKTVTWAALERLPSTCEAATIVSTCGAERRATGVYTPALLIVPHGPLLHPRPLTLQSTLRLAVFETVAVNRNCVPPA